MLPSRVLNAVFAFGLVTMTSYAWQHPDETPTVGGGGVGASWIL